MGYLSQDDTDPYNPRHNITVGVIIAMAVGGIFFVANYSDMIFGSGKSSSGNSGRLERELRMAAQLINQRGSIRVDEITTLTGATARGTDFTYQYSLSRDIPSDRIEEARAVLERDVGAALCRDPNMRRALTDGASIAADYRDSSGDHIVGQVPELPRDAALRPWPQVRLA